MYHTLDGSCKNYDNYCGTAPLLTADCKGTTSQDNFDRHNQGFNTTFCVSTLTNSNGVLICDSYQSWVPGEAHRFLGSVLCPHSSIFIASPYFPMGGLLDVFLKLSMCTLTISSLMCHTAM